MMNLDRLSLLPVLLLAAAAMVWTGCDSDSSVTSVGPDGPTVEFASGGDGAVPDDGSVEIDVQLNDPEGEEVSVEVLFAEGASSATSADVGGLTTDSPIVLTFPADAEDGAVQTFEVDVSEADIAQGAREARFALQRAQPDNVSIGEQAEFNLSIGPIDIAEARERGVGATVTIQGVVTRAFGDFIRIQDQSGNQGASGMVVRQASSSEQAIQFREEIEDGTITEGTEIILTGLITAFNDLQQINNEDLSNYTILSQGNPVAPIQIDDLSPGSDEFLALESVLVEIPNISIDGETGSFSNGTTLTAIDQDGNTLDFRVQQPGETDLNGVSIPEEPFTYRGVVGQFRGTPQLIPVLPSDLVTDEDIDDPGNGDDENGDDENGDDENGEEAEELSIAEARERDDGTLVAVEGVVTRAEGTEMFFQDETGGLQAFDGGGWALDDGDEVRFTGEMDTFNAARQLAVDDFEVIATGGDVPDPITITIADYLADPESVQGQLVQFEGVTIDDKGDDVFQAGGADGSYDITDGSGETTTMRFNGDDNSELVGEPIPGGEVTVTGPTTRRDGDFRILPIRPNDIVEE